MNRSSFSNARTKPKTSSIFPFFAVIFGIGLIIANFYVFVQILDTNLLLKTVNALISQTSVAIATNQKKLSEEKQKLADVESSVDSLVKKNKELSEQLLAK